MIVSSNIAVIIADDLTGANDTALQFHLKGANTQILLSEDIEFVNEKNTQTWAISTETRNVEPDIAYQKISDAVNMFREKINPDYFYKKIDSTIRGNIAVETLGMLDILGWDAALLCAAFPSECRYTVGGYHLLKGTPIERTEMARDVHNPIRESHIPSLLKNQLPEEYHKYVGTVDLKTVMKGAGPVLKRINELIADGKKLIVADAVSVVDVEQLALALNKSDYNILPAGTASFAHALADLWFADLQDVQHIAKTFPMLPKFVVSGSSTLITANQIEKFENSDDFDNSIVISLDMETVLNGVSDELVNRIINNLGTKNIVVVHTSHLLSSFDGFSETSLNAELTKTTLAGKITDFLAELTAKVTAQKQLILVTLGGETSYKCCNAIGANQLQLIDEVAPAIALCMDHNAQWIVTKSGNLGGVNTLVDILKYFENHTSGEVNE